MPDRGKPSSGFLFRDAVIRKRDIRSPAHSGHSGHEPGKGLRIMKTTINTISTIDFSTITTYGELKKVLPSTGTSRVPGINQLRKKAVLLLHRETESGIIEIYDNGFFSFEECGSLTVYGVDRCERQETYSYSGKRIAGEEDPDFSPYPWEMILESAGTSRLNHNSESREQSYSEISIDAPESEDNPVLSVKPEHEIQEEEEDARERRQRKCEKVAREYTRLREDQKQLIDMYFIRKMRQEDIARILGIDQGSVSRRIATVKKRFEIFL